MKCFRMGIVLLFLLIVNCDLLVHAADSANEKYIFVEGDLMIIALFSVHRNRSKDACGEIQEKAGMQRVEVALRQIEDINRNKRNTTCSLGIYIRDTCEQYNPTYTFELELRALGIDSSKIVGMIGPATTEEMANYLSNSRQYQYVLVGYGATGTKLSSRQENHFQYFPSNNFIRVVPPDDEQIKVIIKIVKQYLNCSAINVISSPDDYGENGVEEFRKQSNVKEVCVYWYYKADVEKKKDNYSEVLTKTSEITQVLVCFCDGDTLRDILKATRRMNMTGKFVFIATDRWAERDDVLSGYENEAVGNFFINIMPSRNIDDADINYDRLKDKTKSLTENTNTWMSDLERRRSRNCSSPEAVNSTIPCSENSEHNKAIDSKLSFVMDSIDLINRMIGTKYKPNCQLEERLENPHFKGRVSILNEMPSFRNPYHWNSPYELDRGKYNADGNPKDRSYQILNYQKGNKTFKLELVGTSANGDLKLDAVKVQLRGISKFNTRCRNDCIPGQRFDNETCCWECVGCLGNSFTVTGRQHSCDLCNDTHKAYSNKTGCEPKDEERIYWYEPDAFVCIIVSTFGIFATIISAVIFYGNIHVPIIKYSSPKLTLIIFCGMILAYSYAFLLVLKPGDLLCTVIKFCTSISLTMIYGPLLARTNRTSRAFTVTKLREPCLTWKYFSTKFLMKIFMSCLAVELLMVCVVDYGVFQHHLLTDINKTDEKIITFFCKRDETNQFNSRQLVNVLLLAYTCVFAFKTIKLPDNFYESKFILSFGAATMATWIIYILIFSVAAVTRTVQIALSLVLSTSAFCCLAGFIFPKLYIIIWHPEKHKSYLSTKNKVPLNPANNDSGVTNDMSLWEYLGVASRITPDIIEESELKSTSEAQEPKRTSEVSGLKSNSEVSGLKCTSEASGLKSTSEVSGVKNISEASANYEKYE